MDGVQVRRLTWHDLVYLGKTPTIPRYEQQLLLPCPNLKNYAISVQFLIYPLRLFGKPANWIKQTTSRQTHLPWNGLQAARKELNGAQDVTFGDSSEKLAHESVGNKIIANWDVVAFLFNTFSNKKNLTDGITRNEKGVSAACGA